ncbi:ATP-dependent helicase HrpB [Celerinatantimonas diazotrophica]|uniref:ATP-dependent helicase HrpB n=1 Tax=Celerinatantimonas diazotrophica TaxID=412034 RepID=A0A4R1J8J8_9GAMM|nr:ATP-dependent helicase HrpB [Celerinatantimonas diazotrophica]TCK46915.1 ATP-dependent helicase HrpB [Celerinatantimonas diazotrophica]CAG9295683.1 ATP-dependent RNA helicase HrpB [Celerinatantimonas diazotrophica]
MTNPLSVLPVVSILDNLLQGLSEQSQLLLVAPPGAGKSTAVPLAILQKAQLNGLIIMLEPRRLAARHIAQFLAKMLGEPVGQQVGYQMRGESQRSSATRLLIVTEGILTRMLQDDPMLETVGLVIFDEFHERSLNADLGLALCLEAAQVNESLKLLVMSATLDISALQKVLPEAQLIRSQGRTFPVQVDYAPLPNSGVIESHCAAVIQSLIGQHNGSLLAFLPGTREIRRVAQLLDKMELGKNVSIYQLYGQLTIEHQQKAIQAMPDGQQKIVLATNIAETSLTIEGITVVVDSGLERVAQYHRASGVTRLNTKMICQSSAEQRAGRAGRLSQGWCVRLYSEEQFNHRPRFNDAQILRSDLTTFLAQLKLLGSDPASLHWVDRPPTGALARAEELLAQLGFLDTAGHLTPMARHTGNWSADPRICALLYQAVQLAKVATREILARGAYLAAVLEQRVISAESDFHQMLRTLDGNTRRQIARQGRIYQTVIGADALDERIEHPLDGVLLAAAMPDRIAHRQGDRYLLANGFALQNARVYSDWIIALELGWQEGRSTGQLYLSAEITLEQLEQFYPQWFYHEKVCEYDERRQAFISQQRRCLGAIVVQCVNDSERSQEALLHGWSKLIAQRGMSWLPISAKAQAFRTRVICLNQWLGDCSFPDLSDDALLSGLSDWLWPYLDGIYQYKTLKQLDWLGIFKSLCSFAQLQLLDSLAPTHYQAPSGRDVAIGYQIGETPRISLKLQEMFGQPQSPTVAHKVAITIELLSPGGHVLQLTQDLASFWQNAYPEVRKQMRGRYPKHPWPEDPLDSIATHKTKRQLQR